MRRLSWPSPRRLVALIIVLLVAGLALAAPALASHGRHHHGHRSHHHHSSHHDWDDNDDDSDHDSDDSDDPDDGDVVDVDGGDVVSDAADVGGTVLTGAEKTIQAEITGYSFQDNTPANSAEISHPILHKTAGGTGTYADPITAAVASGSFPAGTRFYVAAIKRYVIVEDTGASDGAHHLDIYVDGKGFDKSDSDACMNSFTDTVTVIQNPGPGHPVTVGPLTSNNGCKI